jgi:DMSO/TMAO reductase YedYZ molybdopterin-dependent catalytic subunit
MSRVFLAITAVMIVVMVIGFADLSYAPLVPEVSAVSSGGDWRLTVSGLVDRALNLSCADLKAMPATSVSGIIVCVGFPDETVASGNWTGVRLWYVLQLAGVSPDATKVAFHATDSYSTDLTVDTAEHGDVIIAYEKDGQALSETLRLVVLGKWGYKWISQLTSVEAVDYDFKGFYESQGYSDDASIPEGSLGYVGGPYPTPGPSPSPNASPTPSPSPPTVPEFPLVLPLLVLLIPVALLVALMRNRGRRSWTVPFLQG